MKIIKAYKTSFGIFLDSKEAHCFRNRKKIHYERDGYFCVYENVEEVYLLQEENKFFSLKQVPDIIHL